MWTNDYVGIPFQKNGSDRNGTDCWRLIVMVYREKLGIELPDFADVFIDGSLASLVKVSRSSAAFLSSLAFPSTLIHIL